MNLFEKLLLARQLSFNGGRIELMGQRVVLFNGDLFANYLEQISNDPKQTSLFYHSVKDSFRDSFAASIGRSNKFTFNDFVKWMADLAVTTGWGNVSWQDIDESKLRGTVVVTDSPVGAGLVGKVKNPIDHPLRGFIAGGASAAFRRNIDVIEDKCVALGDEQCRFILMPTEDLAKANKKLFLEQVGVYGKTR